MVIKTVVLAMLLAGGAAALTGCSTQPADRTHICTEFDTLGHDVLTANGIFDNDVFDSAGDLADLAARYQGSPPLSADAAELHDIAKSDSTSGLELMNATGHIADLCGHPLGIGTTDFGTGVSAGGNNAFGDSSGGSDAGGSGYSGGIGAGSGGNGAGSGGANSGSGGTDPVGGEPDATGSNGGTDAPAVTDEASALAALRQEADADRAAVDRLAGQWVPQLSSKADGLVADGITYDNQAIWQDFQHTRQEYSDALLLWSGDYSSFTYADYWVTVVPMPVANAAQANAWCDGEGLAAEQCYAKLISHDAGPKGATVPR